MAAADLLLRVTDEGLDIEAAMDASERYDALEGADRGFARAIASSTLRALGRLDRVIDSFLKQPLSDIDPSIRALLRIGTAQMWVMGAPSYAVVSATVDAARKWPPASRGGGLVNAILRRADREPAAYSDLPVTTIWPEWLAAKFVDNLGPERANALAELQLRDPRTDITVKSDPGGWAQKLDAEALPSGSVRLPAGASLTQLDGFSTGDWWVQDAGAALAAQLLGDIRDKQVLDLCAAPGGKTLQLAAAGAQVTAIDSDAKRLEKVKENLERCQLTATCVAGDAQKWRPDTLADAILLDAPCSALGTLRRHPEGAWKRKPEGLSRYPETQNALLNAAFEMLKPGGTLIYCVCTPMAAEGVNIINDALKANSDWKRLKVKPEEIAGFEWALTDDGDVLTAPPASTNNNENVTASDLFYIARLTKS